MPYKRYFMVFPIGDESKAKGQLKDILNDVAYMVAGVVLALIVYTSLGYTLNTSDPIVTVVSQSMHPALERGDMLVLQGVPTSELRAGPGGDIIVYVCPASEPRCPQGNKLIVHRIYAINQDGTFTSKGDNNPGPDTWRIEPSWIRGKMILRIPYLGYPRILISDVLKI